MVPGERSVVVPGEGLVHTPGIHQDLEEGRRPTGLERPFTLAFELSDLREPTLWAPTPPTKDVAEAWSLRTYKALLAHDTFLLRAQHAYFHAKSASDHEGKRVLAKEALGRHLTSGLQKLEGAQLDRDQERVFIHLAARAGSVPLASVSASGAYGCSRHPARSAAATVAIWAASLPGLVTRPP